MICLSLVVIAPLLEFLGFSAGVLGILAVTAELTDDYTRDLPSSVQQSKTKSH